MADPIKTTFTLVEGPGKNVMVSTIDMVRLLKNEARWWTEKGTPEGNASARALRRIADIIDTAAMDYSSRNVSAKGGDSDAGQG